jgi:hypothetical protein
VLSSANNDAAWPEEYILVMDGKHSTDILFEYKALDCNGRLWIADDMQLKKDILEAEHDSNVAGHMEQDNTIRKIIMVLQAHGVRIFPDDKKKKGEDASNLIG